MIPALPFVPEHLESRLAAIKPYLLLILKKGENYAMDNSKKIIQSEHMPYLFELRDKGIVDISFPVIDETEVAAIAIINSTDKNTISQHFDNDPAVKAKIFTYELFNGMGLKGDILK
jgi:hypothetical protein